MMPLTSRPISHFQSFAVMAKSSFLYLLLPSFDLSHTHEFENSQSLTESQPDSYDDEPLHQADHFVLHFLACWRKRILCLETSIDCRSLKRYLCIYASQHGNLLIVTFFSRFFDISLPLIMHLHCFLCLYNGGLDSTKLIRQFIAPFFRVRERIRQPGNHEEQPRLQPPTASGILRPTESVLLWGL